MEEIFKKILLYFFMLPKKQLILLALLAFTGTRLMSQSFPLQPGFDKAEYTEMLKITGRQRDTPWTHVNTPLPNRFHLAYRSDVVGLDNRWDLWMLKDSIAVISIRGTTAKTISWLANFYSAMVPASGKIQLSDSFSFRYHLADHPKAAVHIGWLIGTAFLSRDILPKIDSLYKTGIRNMIIMGHSQGGAIAYLLSSYIANLQQTHQVPADIRFKTYCSAAPKPGNLYFAYEYEKRMSDGWGFNVVNSADWVPQTPLSVQAITDFNTTNPFANAGSLISKQPFPKNLAMKYAFNKLNNASKTANRRYERYLGRTVSAYIKKSLPGFQEPEYTKSFDYVRVGPTVVLLADDDYYRQYPDNPKKVFIHHLIDAYLFLTNKLP